MLATNKTDGAGKANIWGNPGEGKGKMLYVLLILKSRVNAGLAIDGRGSLEKGGFCFALVS